MAATTVAVTGVLTEPVGDALLLRTAAEDRDAVVRLVGSLPVETDRVTVVSTPQVTALPQFFVVLSRVLGAELGGSADGIRLLPLGDYADRSVVDRAARGLAERIGQAVTIPRDPLPGDQTGLTGPYEWLVYPPGRPAGTGHVWPTPAPSTRPTPPGRRTATGWSLLDTGSPVTGAPATGTTAAGYVVEIEVGPTGFRIAGRPAPPATLAALLTTVRADDHQPMVLVVTGTAPTGPAAAGLIFGGLATALGEPILVCTDIVTAAVDGTLTTPATFHRWPPRVGTTAPRAQEVGATLPVTPVPDGPAASDGPTPLAPAMIIELCDGDRWRAPKTVEPADSALPPDGPRPDPARVPAPAPAAPPDPTDTEPRRTDSAQAASVRPATDTPVTIPVHAVGPPADAGVPSVLASGETPPDVPADTGSAPPPHRPTSPGDPHPERASGPLPSRAVARRLDDRWGPDDRTRLRQVLDGRYDGYARMVTRVLAEEPGLRAAGTAADVVAALVALCAYGGSERDRINATLRGGTDDTPDRLLLARGALHGLRRLPTVLGAVHAHGEVPAPLLAGYRPGDELVEPAFVDVDLVRRPAPAATVEFAVWSATARRVDRFGSGALFPPGSRFVVLAVDPAETDDRPARVLLGDLTGVGPQPAHAVGRMRDRLRQALEQDAAPPSDTAAPHAPHPLLRFAPGLHDDGRRLVPDATGPASDPERGGTRP
ncbi:hypothetical protein ACIBMZ_16255 [Micromonospora sp. NPDC049900]|uniref:hypothetical protein n=1 Tax=Micromonospora sp. NPDC049900 TaxID=3364275 RepID=UPI003790E349